MSEPTITISARKAALMAINLQGVNTELMPGLAPEYQAQADYLKGCLSKQLTDFEVNQVLVSVDLTISNSTNYRHK